MPVNTWGKLFITTSTPDRSIGDLFRIVSSESDTEVHLSNGDSYSIDKAGDFVVSSSEQGILELLSAVLGTLR